VFQASIEEVLMPTLDRGDTKVMGKLHACKAVDVRRAIEAAGASLAFPAALHARLKRYCERQLQAQDILAEGYRASQ